MILQNLFLTVTKTTGTNEGKVFYSMSLGLGHVTLMTVRSGNDSSLQVCLANTSEKL